MAELRLAVVLAVGVLFVDAGVAKYRLGRVLAVSSVSVSVLDRAVALRRFSTLR